MICNRCGKDSPDDSLSCPGCGHKLQSGRKAPEDGGEAPGEALPFLTGPGPAVRRRARKHIEAWVVAVLVCGVTWWLTGEHWFWPLYPLFAAGAGYAWLRGMSWRD